MYRINIIGYGTSSHLDGCHVLAGVDVVAYVPEPTKRAESRGQYGANRWTAHDEREWREAVRQTVLDYWGAETEGGLPVILLWDPGRDEQESERLEEVNTVAEARAVLVDVLRVGRERTTRSEKAPYGSYPRVEEGYITVCTRCGAESAFYVVTNGPGAMDEWRGHIGCQCRAPFNPPAPWEAGMA